MPHTKASQEKKDSLSVVVIVLEGSEKLERCLAALAGQVNAPTLEIIVPLDDLHADAERLKKNFPDVGFLRIPGEHTYAALRSAGIKRTVGKIVAITEDHCVPSEGWAASIIKAHMGTYAAVGGAVEKLTPDTALNWSLYLADYVRYMNPIEEGPTTELTDCNVSYKRSRLDAIAEVWKGEFHEPEVHTALESPEGGLWYSPNVMVHQQRSITLHDALSDRYRFGRLFGARRTDALSAPKRAVLIVSAFCLPFLLTARVMLQIIRKRRCLPEFLRALPCLATLNTVWAWGELVGYVTGRPDDTLRQT